MNFLGDYTTKYVGVGSETDPSLVFGQERNTGLYLDTPGSSSAYTIAKRGKKRLRIDDNKTTFIGPVAFSGGTSSSSISFPDGSASQPAISFTSNPPVGWWLDTSNPANPTITETAPTTVYSHDVQINGTLSLNGGTSAAKMFSVAGSQTAPLLSVLNGASIYGGTDNSLYVSSTTGPSDLFKFSKTDSKNTSFVPLTTGTNSLTTGSVSCTSMLSTGPVQVPGSLLTAPALQMGGTNSGISYNTSASQMDMVVGGSSQFTVGTGGASLGGHLSVGTYLLTGGSAGISGSVSCQSLTSAGDITQPYYNLSAYLAQTTSQSISNGVATNIGYDTLLVNNNFTWTGAPGTPQSVFTIPVAGWYDVCFETSFASNSTGLRGLGCRMTSALGTSVARGQTTVQATVGNVTRLNGAFQRQFAAGDTLSANVFQNSGGSLNISNDGAALTAFAINRIHA